MMKRFLVILLILSVVQKTSAQEWVSTGQFKEIESATEREKTIAKAPPEQRPELEKMHVHMMKLQEYGSEKAVKFIKEIAVSKARGFSDLSWVFTDYLSLWSYFRDGLIERDKKLGATQAQLATAERVIEEKRLTAINRLEEMHNIVFHLAPSPAAFGLERIASFVRQDFARRTGEYGSQSRPHLTEQDMLEAGREMDQIFEQLKYLPALTAEQYDKEYNDFPESKIER